MPAPRPRRAPVKRPRRPCGIPLALLMRAGGIRNADHDGRDGGGSGDELHMPGGVFAAATVPSKRPRIAFGDAFAPMEFGAFGLEKTLGVRQYAPAPERGVNTLDRPRRVAEGGVQRVRPWKKTGTGAGAARRLGPITVRSEPRATPGKSSNKHRRSRSRGRHQSCPKGITRQGWTPEGRDAAKPRRSGGLVHECPPRGAARGRQKAFALH